MSDESIDLPSPDPDETGPYTLIVTMRAKPGQAGALERRLLALMALTREEAGALAYHVHRDRADPDRLVLYEAWSGIAAFKEHMAKPYLTDFFAEQSAYLDSADISWLRMVSPYESRP